MLGDSIITGVGAETGQGILDRLQDRMRRAGDAREFARFSVGGSSLHSPTGDLNVVAAQVTAAAASGESFDVALIAAGTNDLVTHTDVSLASSLWAAVDVDVALQAMGVRNRQWTLVLPMGLGTSHPDSWLPNLLSRRQTFVTWQRAMWQPKGQLIDFPGMFGDPGTGQIPAGNTFLLPDGLHPSRYGALDVANAIPLGHLN